MLSPSVTYSMAATPCDLITRYRIVKMNPSSTSFHIYDDRKDYSLTNIRDILFDVNKKEGSYEFDNDKRRSSHMNLFGKGYKASNSDSSDEGSSSDDDDTPGDKLEKVKNITLRDDESICPNYRRNQIPGHLYSGPFRWSKSEQRAAIFSFYFAYIPAIIPASLIARRFGAKAVISSGLLVQSLFSMMIPAAAESGLLYLQLVRIVQGVTLAPVLPCTYTILANWIPPCERSRMVTVVLSGTILGYTILHHLSKLLCVCELCGACAAHFYLYAGCSVMLSMFFTFFLWEDPETCPVISDKERHYIFKEMGLSHHNVTPSKVPWKSMALSMPCWALLFAEVAEQYFLNTSFGETNMYMETVIHSSLRDFDLESTLPVVLMLSSCLVIAITADYIILKEKMRISTVRKLLNSLALYGGALGISIVAHLGCNTNYIVTTMSITMLINGAHFSGLKVNYLEITHKFTGILVAITSVMGNISSIASHFIALRLSQGKQSFQKYQLIFFIAAMVSVASATAYIFLASSKRQNWDDTLPPTVIKAKSVNFVNDEPIGDSASDSEIVSIKNDI